MKKSTRRNQERKKKENIKMPKFLVLMIIIAIVVISILLIKKDKLYGSWTTDGNTIYEFNGKGNGALIVPSAKVYFTYKIKDNRLSIDFTNDAKDANYEFSIINDTLTLSGIEKTKGTYTMTKK